MVGCCRYDVIVRPNVRDVGASHLGRHIWNVRGSSYLPPRIFFSLLPTNNNELLTMGEGKEYTLEQVSKHNKQEDCWLIIGNLNNGKENRVEKRMATI